MDNDNNKNLNEKNKNIKEFDDKNNPSNEITDDSINNNNNNNNTTNSTMNNPLNSDELIAKNLYHHEIVDEMKKSYIDYAMSVIVGRALPDVRDGLKPVHRRVLYSMSELGLFHNKPFKKCARIVGDCLGKYHPHGDIAVYDTLVRMAQPFSLRYPLVDGQGNFGSIDGDSPAAMRYTEARLSKIAEEMLEDLDKETVDFMPNFDGSLKEPVVLPSKIPNLIINGSSGIAVGMATHIPPHNLIETCEGIKAYIDNPDITIDELLRIMKGADFPTGGIIIGTSGIKNYFYTGKGKLKVRAKVKIETKNNSKDKIIIEELPYQVNKANMVKAIADLVRNKIIDGISDLRDESDRDGIRVVIEVKKNYNPQVLLNKLYIHSNLEITYGVDLLALVNNVPKRMSMKELIFHYVNHRKKIVINRLNYELKKNQARLHILNGLIKALLNIDQTIKIIKSAKDTKSAKKDLIEFLEITDEQAQAILDLKLQRLTSLEQEKIKEEAKNLEKRITEIKDILSSETKIYSIIKKELDELEKEYGDDRKTEIIEDNEEDINDEKLVNDEENIILITKEGYLKRMGLEEYKTQNRGGKGVIGINMKDEDEVKDIFHASTLDNILFFSNRGKVYWKKVYQLPIGSRLSKGKALINLIKLDNQEKITSTICLRDFNDNKYVFFVTKRGIVKKVNLINFSKPRKTGTRAILLDENDELINTFLTSGKDEIIIATKMGFAVRFNEFNVRAMGRSTRGVKGIKLKNNDVVVSAAPVENSTMLTITTKGFGKRTKIEDYRITKRGASGVINQICNEKTGYVVGVIFVNDEDNIIIITKKGIVIKIPVKTIHISHRNTIGVRIIRLKENDEVVSIDKIKRIDNEK